MGAIASQITGLTIVHSTVYSDADQWKHQSSASLVFVRGIHRRPVDTPHKWPVTRKMFLFDDVIMSFSHTWHSSCWKQYIFIGLTDAPTKIQRANARRNVIYFFSRVIFAVKNWDCILAGIIILDDIECYMINHVSTKAMEIKFVYKDLRSQAVLLAVNLIIRSWHKGSVWRDELQLRRRIRLLAHIHLNRETSHNSCVRRLHSLSHACTQACFRFAFLCLCDPNNANQPILFPTYEN